MHRVIIAWTILFACCTAAIVQAIYPSWGSVAASLQAIVSVVREFISYPLIIAGVVCLACWVLSGFPPTDSEGKKVEVENLSLRFYLCVIAGVMMAYLLGLEMIVLSKIAG